MESPVLKLSKIKMDILADLATDERVQKVLFYKEANFLDQPQVEDPSALIYTHLLPFYRVPQSEEEVSAYISVILSRVKLVRGSTEITQAKLFFYVFNHINLMRCDYEGVPRCDYIRALIDSKFNGCHIGGLGRLELDSSDEYMVNPQYVGAHVSYDVYDTARGKR